MDKHDSIYVAGGDTLVAAAILERLEHDGYRTILRSEQDIDLTDPSQVDDFFAIAAPQYVFLVAGESGGIAANQKYPAHLMYNNLLVQCNVIHSAHRYKTKRLLYLASSCVYPRDCPQPMKEDALLTGPLEATNEAYAVAKIAGIKLCQAYNRQFGADFVSAIPSNVFGPGDDFSPEDSHVIPGLLRRMHSAKISGHESVDIWGTGTAQRDFIFIDDLADACIFIIKEYGGQGPINIGTGTTMSVRELAELTKGAVGYPGELRFDASKPDGMPYKALDSGVLNAIGWRPKTPFHSGLQATYDWYMQTIREDSIALGKVVI